MGRPKTIIDAELAARAARELAGLSDKELHLRLLAVVKAHEFPIGQVADFYGVARDTVCRWIRRFRAFGLEGLRDRPKGHNPAKLNQEQLARIATWLDNGQDEDGHFVHWTLARLRLEVAQRLEVKLGATPLRGHVKRLGFKLKVPRPSHAKANPEAQFEFKKKRRRKRPRS